MFNLKNIAENRTSESNFLFFLLFYWFNLLQSKVFNKNQYYI